MLMGEAYRVRDEDERPAALVMGRLAAGEKSCRTIEPTMVGEDGAPI
jgi:hypothetical protein